MNNYTMKWLIYGSNGWIGGYIVKILTNDTDIIIRGKARVDNAKDVNQEILDNMPDRIISLIGRTSGPGFNSIDYLEQPDKLNINICDNLFSDISWFSSKLR